MEAAIQTVTLSIYRFDSVLTRLWVLGQMGAARLSFMRMKACSFWKLCGSGTGEGFTPKPNTAVWAILAVWPDVETAEEHTQNARIYRRWVDRADESWTVFLTPTSARGIWSGQSPFEPETLSDGPIAALTRATIRPRHILKFWRKVPDISQVIGSNADVAFKIGIGELPWLHQVTFSIWPDEASMAAFARKDGPHARAIRAVRDGDWFSEELYARFRVTGSTGTWKGAAPLDLMDVPA